MPRTSDHDPLLSIYFDLQMGFIAFALFGEALVFICLQQPFKRRKIPKLMASIFCIPRLSKGNSRTQSEFRAPMRPGSNSNLKLNLYSEQANYTSSSNPENLHRVDRNPIIRRPSMQMLNSGAFDDGTVGSPSVEIMRNQTLNKDSFDFKCKAALRFEWEMMANRIEHIIVITYVGALIITPLVMALLNLNTDIEPEFKELYPHSEMSEK